MKLGIIGLPNAGKSTLFNALTRAGALTANYAFSTIEPNVGMISVPDERLTFLSGLENSQKITHATIEFVDIAGLVEGASKGEGLGNKFLSHIREVDAVVHVLRCFTDSDGTPPDPISDMNIINFELMLSDLEIVERRIEKTQKAAKADRSLNEVLAVYEKMRAMLEDGVSAREFGLDEKEQMLTADMPLLSSKPIMYVINVSESDLAGDNWQNAAYFSAVSERADAVGAPIIPICASLEAELGTLSDEERAEFLEELGLEETSRDRFIFAAYTLLGLISFFTTGPKETRAWTITLGTKAQRAAGKIHSDIERGFIRAEVIGYEDLHAAGSVNGARERGQMRLEGKEYIMKDGDVVVFRFNV
ncbi:MAG: redox-regulated ATPase YchF [Oscillospiraceae bacterium]|nr:redox-regulated ATPase YchF [Oscillospiraceae bacterium]